MPKILFVATVVKIHIAVFHLPYIRMMKELGWETAVAAKNDLNRIQLPFSRKRADEDRRLFCSVQL